MTKARLWAAIITIGFLFSISGTSKMYADWSNETTVSATVAGGARALDSLCTGPSLYSALSDGGNKVVSCLNNQSDGTTVATRGGKTYVGFPGDLQLSLVGDCPALTCSFSAKTDSLIQRARVDFTDVWSLTVYSHATERFHKSASGYSVDFAAPDYVARANTGAVMPVASMAISANGQWLGLEILNGGFAVMNLETHEVTKVNNTVYHYGTGLNPTVSMAVANDGKMLVVSGVNADNFVVVVRAGCGQDVVHQPVTVLAACPRYDIARWATVAHDFQYATKPWIDDGQITIGSLYRPNAAYVVTARLADYTASPIDYLGLGDSYTSGEGEADEAFYQDETNTSVNKCHTSRRSYPYIVAHLTTPLLSNVHSVACSGATIRDVVASTNGYEGKGLPGVQAGVEVQRAALDAFIPGVVPQADFVSRYQPRVITVGIGGNDAGLMDKLRACVMPDECEWASPTMRPRVAQEIGGLFDKLVTLYQELHRRSPQSQLYAVGYPQIINPDGQCDALTYAMFDANERQFIVEALRYLDQVVQAAAQKVGIRYLDIEQAYGAHRLCSGLMNEPALNTIQYGDDMAPIPQLPKLMLVSNGSFHPTPLGHQLVATAIRQQQANLMSKNLCGDILCPRDVAVPTPSRYWEGKKGNPSQLLATTLTVNDTVDKEKSLVVTMPAGTFAPDSLVRVEVHSIPQTIADVKTDHDGSMTARFYLPRDIGDGYHTVHVYGTSYAGNAIDRYQTLWVGQRYNISPLVVTDTATLSSSIIKSHDAISVQVGAISHIARTPSGTVTTDADPVNGAVEGVATHNLSTKGSSTAQHPAPIHAWKFIILVVIISALCVGLTGVIACKNSKNGF